MSEIVLERRDIIVNTDMYIDEGAGPYVRAYLIDTRKIVDIVDKIRNAKGYKSIFLEPLDENVWYDFFVHIPCSNSIIDLKAFARIENADDEDDENEYVLELTYEQKTLIYNAVKKEYEKYVSDGYTFENYLRDIEASYSDEENNTRLIGIDE